MKTKKSRTLATFFLPMLVFICLMTIIGLTDIKAQNVPPSCVIAASHGNADFQVPSINKISINKQANIQ